MAWDVLVELIDLMLCVYRILINRWLDRSWHGFLAQGKAMGELRKALHNNRDMQQRVHNQ